jgi:hypothetical protein
MFTSHVCNQCKAHGAGAPRVLVVDDYRGAAIATATYLSLDGMEARVAGGFHLIKPLSLDDLENVLRPS